MTSPEETVFAGDCVFEAHGAVAGAAAVLAEIDEALVDEGRFAGDLDRAIGFGDHRRESAADGDGLAVSGDRPAVRAVPGELRVAGAVERCIAGEVLPRRGGRIVRTCAGVVDSVVAGDEAALDVGVRGGHGRGGEGKGKRGCGKSSQGSRLCLHGCNWG